MIKRSYNSLKYNKASEYNMINVWADQTKREEHVKRLMLADKNFKMTSLKVNPLYKPVFDKLDALAKKEIDALD